MNTYIKKSVCPYDCPDACGLLIETDGTNVISVKGDPDHPVTRGLICRKMQNYEKDIHSPERIMTPLKRVGKKGLADSFCPITWDEAIHEICSKWKSIGEQYGFDSIMGYSYAGTMGIIQRKFGEAFFARMGAATTVRTICSSAKGAAIKHVMGHFHDWNASHIPEADVLILWSANPVANRLHAVPYINQARKNKAKVILIDVYRHDSASLCDEVILVKPGTDAVLMLAMMHVLEKEKLIDHTFIEAYTTGYDALRETFRGCTPEYASGICGVPAETIHSLALLFGKASCPMILPGSGMSRYSNGSAAYRHLFALLALTGAWAKGGGTCCVSGSGDHVRSNLVSHPELIDPKARRVNMNQLSLALTEDDRIKSLYVFNSNPAVMTPDQQGVSKGLSREDLFLVVHDRFMTDTALYADIILPTTFSVEQDDICYSYGNPHLQVSWQTIPAPGACKSNLEVFQLLAEGMGFEDKIFQKTAKEMVNELIESDEFFLFDITEEQRELLKKGESITVPQPDVMDFGTPDKKIHLADLPVGYTPVSDQKYPLRMVNSHNPWSLNSNFAYREELMKSRGPLTMKMHPDDARARGIEDGDLCYAYNDYGKITVQIRIIDGILPGTVNASGVYRKAHTFGDGNFNSLCGPNLTDDGEAAALNTQSIEIVKKVK